MSFLTNTNTDELPQGPSSTPMRGSSALTINKAWAGTKQSWIELCSPFVVLCFPLSHSIHLKKKLKIPSATVLKNRWKGGKGSHYIFNLKLYQQLGYLWTDHLPNVMVWIKAALECCSYKSGVVKGVPELSRGSEWDGLKGPFQPKPCHDSMNQKDTEFRDYFSLCFGRFF